MLYWAKGLLLNGSNLKKWSLPAFLFLLKKSFLLLLSASFSRFAQLWQSLKVTFFHSLKPARELRYSGSLLLELDSQLAEAERSVAANECLFPTSCQFPWLLPSLASLTTTALSKRSRRLVCEAFFSCFCFHEWSFSVARRIEDRSKAVASSANFSHMIKAKVGLLWCELTMELLLLRRLS